MEILISIKMLLNASCRIKRFFAIVYLLLRLDMFYPAIASHDCMYSNNNNDDDGAGIEWEQSVPQKFTHRARLSTSTVDDKHRKDAF